jgi:cytoskeletal protein CcmA (bactofilin family)
LGDITAATVTIAGKVKGNIVANESLELLPKAQILGDLHTAKLMISDGATFEGNCQMLKGNGQVIELNPQGEGHKNLKVIAANGKH